MKTCKRPYYSPYFKMIFDKNPKILKVQVKKYINAVDERFTCIEHVQGFNALCYAIYNGYKEVFELLYEQQYMWTNTQAIRLPTEMFSETVTEFQLAPESNIFMVAVLRDQLELIKHALSIPELQSVSISIMNKENKAGFTLLDLVALLHHRKQQEYIEYLWPYIKESINVKTLDLGWTCVHYATYYKRWWFLKKLYDLDKNFLLQQVRNLTPDTINRKLMNFQWGIGSNDYTTTSQLIIKYREEELNIENKQVELLDQHESYEAVEEKHE